MASKQFNSVDGYSTGNSGSTINVIDAAGNITASGSITRNSRNVPTVVHQANTPPSSPLEGDQWYNTTTGVLFEYLNDGTSSQWVDVNGLPGVVGPILFPGGTANAVVYLNSSSETATSSSFVFDGTNVTAPRFTSTVATGTSPLVVSSTTVVANLNANALQGSTPATANTASTIALRDANGNISANFFIGNGSLLTNVTANTANIANIANSVTLANVSGAGNIASINLNGNANTYLDGTGAWSIVSTWDYYAINWSTAPVQVGTTLAGDVYSYVLGATTRYRLVPTVYNPVNDSFYLTFTGGVLSNLIVSRG